MGLRKHLVFVLLLTCLIAAIAPATEVTDAAPPELKIPQPPEPQEGDDAIVETTVGHMRNALFYYELVPLLIDHKDELYEYAYEVAKRADTERMGRLIAEEEAQQWKRRSIYIGSAGAIATALVTILLLIT